MLLLLHHPLGQDHINKTIGIEWEDLYNFEISGRFQGWLVWLWKLVWWGERFQVQLLIMLSGGLGLTSSFSFRRVIPFLSIHYRLYTSGRVNCGSPFFSLTSLFVVVVVLVASVWFISIDDVCPLVS